MKPEICVRKLAEHETEEALRLAWQVFLQFEAPVYPPEGVEEFDRSLHDANFVSRLSFYGAFAGGRLAGVLATRNEGGHIALFFVEEAFQRRGIGRQLFSAALARCTGGKMTVNASPYAVPVYRRLGFREAAGEQVVNGLRFTPMALEIQR